VLVAAVCLLGFIFSNTNPNKTPTPCPSAEKTEVSLNGVPTGDSYVLVVFNMSSVPDMGTFYRDNQRLEQLGYVMDPSTFRVSQGYGACSIFAAYHKKK
jgi:hypothetical protein